MEGEVIFTNNLASSAGGALSILSPDGVRIKDAVFTPNTAVLGGAVSMISTLDGTKTFEGCIFENNEAGDEGAMYFHASAREEVVSNYVFKGNFARESWQKKSISSRSTQEGVQHY